MHSIGVFDSGVGGLTVVRELRRLMPNEKIIYVGDTARAPYGGKDAETLISHGREIIRFLLEKKARMVVMACGTSSSTSLKHLRSEFPDIPIVDTIRPAVKATVEFSRKIPDFKPVFIATSATIKSGLFTKLLAQELPETDIYSRACPLFAPIIEAGFFGDHPLLSFAAESYLSDLRGKVNALILGCTHYPLLTEALAATLGDIAFINPAAATAQAAKNLLKSFSKRPRRIEYHVSGDTEEFAKIASAIMNEKCLPLKIKWKS